MDISQRQNPIFKNSSFLFFSYNNDNSYVKDFQANNGKLNTKLKNYFSESKEIERKLKKTKKKINVSDVSKYENILHPEYMGKNGTMCSTELWALKDKYEFSNLIDEKKNEGRRKYFSRNIENKNNSSFKRKISKNSRNSTTILKESQFEKTWNEEKMLESTIQNLEEYENHKPKNNFESFDKFKSIHLHSSENIESEENFESIERNDRRKRISKTIMPNTIRDNISYFFSLRTKKILNDLDILEKEVQKEKQKMNNTEIDKLKVATERSFKRIAVDFLLPTKNSFLLE